MPSNNQSVEITHVQRWLKEVVIDLNFCPFAKREVDKNRVRYQLSSGTKIDDLLDELSTELLHLVKNEDVSTTLIIYSSTATLDKFESYLDFLDIANELLIESGYEGVFQIASFHPDYCFEGEKADAPSNYTNRSPYPIIHILRESSIDVALTHVADASKIPERNISYANKLGLTKLQQRLARCRQDT